MKLSTPFEVMAASALVAASPDEEHGSVGRELFLQELVIVGLKSDYENWEYYPLPECWGDCHVDSDCQNDLVCCQRSSMEEQVLGCSGSVWESTNYDFCVKKFFCPSWTESEEEDTQGSTFDFDNDDSANNNETDSSESDTLPLAWNNTEDPWQFLPFCLIPQEQDDYVINNCKANYKNEEWAKAQFGARKNGVNITYYDRPLSKECGPHCRPSCVTLMLDLDQFDQYNDPTCRAGELCQCSHQKQFQCGEERLENLFDEYPKCYLETADCLGPTFFDDVIAHAEWQDGQIKDLNIEHCTHIPDDELYCRFQEWDLVTPIEKYSCEEDMYPECLNRERKLYWEYCHIVEEDPFCDVDESCDGNRCGKHCDKRTEPFPNGWTTFTVTGSVNVDPLGLIDSEIPDSNDHCNERLPLAVDSKAACFMQRVEFYFPADDEGCGIGCPNCHECPLLNLGDKFGPLEVVGFGHSLHGEEEDHTCSSCDQAHEKHCEKGCELDCDDLFEWKCEESVDCHTGQEIGFLNFENNQCSWGVKDIPTGYIEERAAIIEIQEQALITDEAGSSLTRIFVVLAVLLLVSLLFFLAMCARRPSTKATDHQVKADDNLVKGVTILHDKQESTDQEVPVEITLVRS